jgi:hypothetical protein
MRGVGGGRPPKPEGQKRNRTPPTRARRTLAEAPKPAVQAVPEPLCALSTAGKAVWERMWGLPEASQWKLVDIPALSRLVWLQQNPENWIDNRMLSEVRQLEDRFGMNAYARHHLGWDKPEEEPAPVSQTKPAGVADRKAEALRLLRGQTA